MLRTAGLLALPRRTLSVGFDGRISPNRRHSATRRLGPYRGQTFTGKPNAACLDTHRGSSLRQALHRSVEAAARFAVLTPGAAGERPPAWRTDQCRGAIVVG